MAYHFENIKLEKGMYGRSSRSFSQALEEGEALAWEATRFRVRSCRPYYIGNALSHYWAALEQEREAAECGS